MKNFINYSIASTLASVGATIVLVLLIDNLVLAALATVFVLVAHTVSLVLFGYYEIMAEFAIKKNNRVKSRETVRL